MEKPSLLGLSRVATNEDAINRDNGNNYYCANMQVFDDLFAGVGNNTYLCSVNTIKCLMSDFDIKRKASYNVCYGIIINNCFCIYK